MAHVGPFLRDAGELIVSQRSRVLVDLAVALAKNQGTLAYEFDPEHIIGPVFNETRPIDKIVAHKLHEIYSRAALRKQVLIHGDLADNFHDKKLTPKRRRKRARAIIQRANAILNAATAERDRMLVEGGYAEFYEQVYERLGTELDSLGPLPWANAENDRWVEEDPPGDGWTNNPDPWY